MATVAAIRTALKTAIAAGTGLRAIDYRPGSVSPPVAIVALRETRYDVTMDGADDTTMAVTVYVQFGTDRTSEEDLNGYMDPAGATSVVAAIHADPTLGGVVDFARVVSVTDLGLVEYGGAFYLAAVWIVEVGD